MRAAQVARSIFSGLPTHAHSVFHTCVQMRRRTASLGRRRLSVCRQETRTAPQLHASSPTTHPKALAWGGTAQARGHGAAPAVAHVPGVPEGRVHTRFPSGMQAAGVPEGCARTQPACGTRVCAARGMQAPSPEGHARPRLRNTLSRQSLLPTRQHGCSDASRGDPEAGAGDGKRSPASTPGQPADRPGARVPDRVTRKSQNLAPGVSQLCLCHPGAPSLPRAREQVEPWLLLKAPQCPGHSRAPSPAVAERCLPLHGNLTAF